MENTREILTPKNKIRSLGLKRNIQRTTAAKTPQSDARICYKSLQDNGEASPSTLCLPQLPLRTSACTTTKCMPSYRLSLSRRIRDNCKKKKLEFANPTREPEADHLQEQTSTCSRDNRLPSNLLEEIDIKERLLKAHQNHQAKVNELRAVINIWKAAFQASLHELSSRVQPEMGTVDLIARLGIEPEMIEYA